MDFPKIYQRKGLIKKENIGFDQVVKHIDRANIDLKVSRRNLTIDTEAAYNYAYLAMLRTGRALMFSCSYRPIDGRQHKTVVEFCEYILGKKYTVLVKHFDRMRQKRNKFTYDEPGLIVSDTETISALEKAEKFVREITKFIQGENPQAKLFS
ncbi:hypothetical protein HZA39_00090 [Candidatus Peregrinibacteria bacterium]|nr:hypothetical protein [Candidatus Peregrinibacteria bacterium]